ncbi:MAG: 1-acyl-sn-glycerol-3-phosphate acyltransferase [Chitinophagaceae bacterium]
MLLKIYARLAIRLFCRHIRINQPQLLKSSGPLLLAANHPNSFLDGILLTTLFDNDIYSLARGDAFKNKHLNKFLRWLRLLPVYRTSEGVENLGHNYTTFAACCKTFEKGGIVLIFSEGRCENEWYFRPLKKGTARLALSAWQDGIPLQVLPVAFNYSSFKKFGKTVHIDFGEEILEADIDRQDAEGKQLLQFNQLLHRQLHPRVYEIAPDDKATVNEKFIRDKSTLFYALLFLPAMLGLLLHAPLFFPVQWFTQYRFGNSGHFDSVIHSLLMLLYPLYLLIAIIIAFKFIGLYALLVTALFPFTAWAWLQWSEVLE